MIINLQIKQKYITISFLIMRMDHEKMKCIVAWYRIQIYFKIIICHTMQDCEHRLLCYVVSGLRLTAAPPPDK